MRVLIAGAGVAGLSAARGLALAGHDVEVYEAAPELRTEGGSISIWPATVGVLREFKVDLDGAGRRLEAMVSLSTRGRRLGAIDLTAAARAFDGLPALHIARRELVERLADGVPVRYGHEIADVDPDRAEITFAHGTTARGDLLVGADGRRSAVRRALGGGEARLNGWVTWQSFTTLPADVVDGARTLMISNGRSLGSIAPAGHGRALWWFDLRAKPGGRFWGDAPDIADRLRERFGHWPEPFPTVLEHAGDLGFYPHHLHRVPSVWGRGPTTLLGDAAHTMPPAMAMGAAQAIEDAWALSRTPEDPRAYERARAKTVRRVARMVATEMPSRQGPLTGIVPDARSARSYVKWLRSATDYF